MTKNDIIAELYDSPNLNKYLNCLVRNDKMLMEDLKQELMIMLLDKPDDTIVGLYEKNSLMFYVVRVLQNNYNSSSSPFYTKYRKMAQKESDFETVFSNILYDTIND